MKKYYKDIILHEVYHDKKRNFIQRFYLRLPGFGKNANYMLRKVQAMSEERKTKLGYLKWRCLRSKFERRYGCFIGPEVKIDKGLILPHPNGIIFGKGVKIGGNCTVYQQVTFGGKHMTDSENGDMPVVGNNCIFYAGSKILGNIYIADGTIVGANSVLLTDTVRNGIYVGTPAVLKKINE